MERDDERGAAGLYHYHQGRGDEKTRFQVRSLIDRSGSDCQGMFRLFRSSWVLLYMFVMLLNAELAYMNDDQDDVQDDRYVIIGLSKAGDSRPEKVAATTRDRTRSNLLPSPLLQLIGAE